VASCSASEKGETLLKTGDVLIQRGTNHSWSVRGNEPCIVAVVLVSAKPMRSAAIKFKEAASLAKQAKKVYRHAKRQRSK
jgi:quercetin dioxygenase-like cupin family protein